MEFNKSSKHKYWRPRHGELRGRIGLCVRSNLNVVLFNLALVHFAVPTSPTSFSRSFRTLPNLLSSICPRLFRSTLSLLGCPSHPTARFARQFGLNLGPEKTFDFSPTPSYLELGVHVSMPAYALSLT